MNICKQRSVDKSVYCGTHCDTLQFPQWVFFLREEGYKGRGWVQRDREMSWTGVHDMKLKKNEKLNNKKHWKIKKHEKQKDKMVMINEYDDDWWWWWWWLWKQGKTIKKQIITEIKKCIDRLATRTKTTLPFTYLKQSSEFWRHLHSHAHTYTYRQLIIKIINIV